VRLLYGGIRHRCGVTLAAARAFLAAVDSLYSILRATSSSRRTLAVLDQIATA
jgi:hypothetical protein